jgi:EAL domain-containing protein (putative c-di-GMP-specific phosphodiesterase class I)
MALALHLSRLSPPAPRPHHSRIARAVLDDAASRREGQLFTLLNGDLVLLFPANDGGVGLSTTLAHLFAPDAPDPTILLSRWLLPVDTEKLFAFLDALPTLAAAPQTLEPDAQLCTVAQLSDAVEPERVRDLLERQTGILVATSGAHRVVPMFREVRFSLPALEARAAASGHVTADPFVFRHLIAKLGGGMLAAATADLERDDSILGWARDGRFALHINMSMDAVLSPALLDLAEAVAATDARIAVEIALVDAYADADQFVQARERLRARGFGVVLDDVSHHALMVTRPAALQPDLVKLDWSRQLPQAGDSLDAALNGVGVAKIVLQKADTEEAMRWGLARGIRRFQGRHVDNILAAGRISACPEAALCTVRKCAGRESAATASGRSGCGNLALLDAAIPQQRNAA